MIRDPSIPVITQLRNRDTMMIDNEPEYPRAIKVIKGMGEEISALRSRIQKLERVVAASREQVEYHVEVCLPLIEALKDLDEKE